MPQPPSKRLKISSFEKVHMHDTNAPSHLSLRASLKEADSGSDTEPIDDTDMDNFYLSQQRSAKKRKIRPLAESAWSTSSERLSMEGAGDSADEKVKVGEKRKFSAMSKGKKRATEDGVKSAIREILEAKFPKEVLHPVLPPVMDEFDEGSESLSFPATRPTSPCPDAVVVDGVAEEGNMEIVDEKAIIAPQNVDDGGKLE